MSSKSGYFPGAYGVCLIIAALLVLGPGLTLPAGAQEAGEQPAAVQERPTAIEEIVVTARKRSERLQEVPVAITALNSSELEFRDFRRADEISNMVPNLVFDPAIGDSASARIYIRGVGNGDPSITDESGVGVYYDGIYMARAQGVLLTLSDVERVEVLRGPQGTLYGKNTIGGAINIITQKPNFDGFSGRASVRIGNNDTIESRLSLNIPLIDERAAMRLALATATSDGFTENKLAGSSDWSDNKLLGGRMSLRLIPTENTELLLTGERTREHRKPSGGECRPVSTPSALGSLWELVSAFSAIDDDPTNLLPSFVAACSESSRRDELDFNSDVGGAGDELDTYGTSATFTWDLSETLTLKSIASWRRQELRGDIEFDFTELQLGTQFREPQQQDQISAELQLNGQALDDRLDFTTGLYWFREKADKAETTLIATAIGASLPLALFPDPALDPRFALLSFLTAGQTVSGIPLNLFLLSPFSVILPDASDFRSTKTANLSYAAYAQATYDVTDRLSLTGGMRFTHERREMDAFSRLIFTGGVRIPKQKVSDRFDAWTPMASVSYRLTDDLMGYASWSRGFKSGGFNGRATGGAELESYDPEEIESWEVGLKSSLFDRRLQLNFAAFYSDYEDIQTTVTGVDPDNLAIFTAVIENASEATVKGLELEAVAQPMPGLHLTASFGLLDAEYDEWKDIDPTTGAVIDKSDLDFAGGPNFTMNLAARYTFAFLKLGTMNARAEWAHAGSRFNDPENQDGLFAGKTGLLSARIALELNDGQTEIAIFGKNLLDRRYLANGINFEDIAGFVAGYYGPERTYGIEVRRDF